MRRIALTGVNAIGKLAHTANEVSEFVDEKDYFSISYTSGTENVIKLATPKGVYLLKRNRAAGIFQGVCAGKKVHVSLKKIVGEVRFWV